MTALKWGAIIVVAWFAFKWLAGMYDTGSVNIGTEGIVGRGWAAPVNVVRNDVSAWRPPYGVPHEGAIG